MCYSPTMKRAGTVAAHALQLGLESAVKDANVAGNGRGSAFDFTLTHGQRSGDALERLLVLSEDLKALQFPSAPSSRDVQHLYALDDELRRAVSQVLSAPDEAELPVIERVEGVRSAYVVLFDAYRLLAQSPGFEGDPAFVARYSVVGTERIKWHGHARHIPDEVVWSEVGALFAATLTDSVGMVVGHDEGVRQEYLRSLGFHAAALEQLSLPVFLAVDRLVTIALPFLVLVREPLPCVCYVIDPLNAPLPRRSTRPGSAQGWFFSSAAALELLTELAEQLRQGVLPPGLDDGSFAPLTWLAAVVHLQRHWSPSPPLRRFRRHSVAAHLLVVSGFDAVVRVFDTDAPDIEPEVWVIKDLSRGGVGAAIDEPSVRAPELGSFLAVRPQDGDSWHLGIVRRVRRGEGETEIGVETISQRPIFASADDGRAPVRVFLCDPLLRGEAVRVIATAGALQADSPLFITSEGAIQKLKPLDISMSGEGFDLRVYQVL